MYDVVSFRQKNLFNAVLLVQGVQQILDVLKMTQQGIQIWCVFKY